MDNAVVSLLCSWPTKYLYRSRLLKLRLYKGHRRVYTGTEVSLLFPTEKPTCHNERGYTGPSQLFVYRL